MKPTVSGKTKQSGTRPGSAGLSRKLMPYGFLIPIFASMGIFKFYPLAIALLKSFYEWNGANLNRWTGLTHYKALASDPTFHIALRNMAVLTGAYALIQLVMPLAGALLVYHLRGRRLRALCQTAFLLPMVVPSVIVYLLWRWIYASNGVINTLLGSLGWDSLKHAWLGESSTALASVLFVGFPWVGGVSFLLFLAGLTAIPTELYEAARLEGAGRWRRLTQLELPLLKGSLGLVLLLAVIHQVQSFENVLVLTNGGPGFATMTPALYLYKKGFEYNDFGYASAIGVVLFAGLLIFTLLTQRFMRNTEGSE
ncbi:sugar ABC transporter permease [Paenibacillus aurantius]|uniref:Sugar ABC transporter permease n=1 Tax=Paenibacillus aurantius TaxID=2918900 RepID=A0AA96RDU3_9BACL|nr:sugar ABC transporter permease [Paenibacillus aurantius]WNQ09478.1 sugar ABC transporter permease [Paenibacillus aurantius]